MEGTADAKSLNHGELVIDGLLVKGKLTVQKGNLGSLQVAHCTLVPGTGGIKVLFTNVDSKRNDALMLTVRQTICGGIVLPNVVPSLCVTESIIDQQGGTALQAEGAVVEIERSTILGKTSVRRLEASNSIFTDPEVSDLLSTDVVKVKQRQVGCVRFCVLPYTSRTPRRFRCQPDLALAERAAQLGRPSAENLTKAEKDAVLARLQPVFTSSHYGDPAYAQLSIACAEEIRTGADDGSEMGVFSSLQQPQREANLRAALEEYLRFGMEAGIFYVT